MSSKNVSPWLQSSCAEVRSQSKPEVLSDQIIPGYPIEITVDHRRNERTSKRVRFSKIPLRSSTPICSLIRKAKLFIKRHIWFNLKAMDAAVFA